MKLTTVLGYLVGFSCSVNTTLNIPITDDPYYGHKVGDWEKYAMKLRPTNFTKSSFVPDEARSLVGTLDDAKYYTSHAGLSYCSEKAIKDWTCKHCLRLGNKTTVVAILDHPQYEGRAVVFIDEKREEVHLSFRGSINTKNWIENLKFDKTNFGNLKGAQVHIGFKNVADSMKDTYIKELSKIYSLPQYKDYRLILSGHSSGGAVALIAMLHLQSALNLSWDRINAFTYGQPRVGNSAFIEYLNRLPLHVTRTVNENDIVAHMPPNFAGYYHYHTEVYINNNVPTICRVSEVEDAKCSNSRVPFVNVQSHMSAWGIPLGTDGC